MMDFIEKKMNSMERRVQYDIKHKSDEIIDVVKAAMSASTVQSFLEKPLMNKLPLQTCEEFETFEIEIKKNEELRQNLQTHILRQIASSLNVREAVKCVMPSLIKKDVQIKYSGKGKKSKGVGKLDFSATALYSCIAAKESDVSSAIGTWLAQSGDREGGRKNRNLENSKADNTPVMIDELTVNQLNEIPRPDDNGNIV
ncbi:uncharacterized protein LOC127278038 [Leptopilina boulardi]|uniref:uncharacterized protein LOC127278038 n=1 Tax=Leptopilina boulardi TaxID=63433 RepID=UPI0021F512C7|nr:uncharacterized protein LOC127278038 [Leptopilina boulardi]